jgi:hypothetical protein
MLDWRCSFLEVADKRAKQQYYLPYFLPLIFCLSTPLPSLAHPNFANENVRNISSFAQEL